MVFGGVHHSAKGASLPSQPLPGPFTNGPYEIASLAPPCIPPRRGGGWSVGFEDRVDFVEEGWEFVLNDFPDFSVSDFWVSVD